MQVIREVADAAEAKELDRISIQEIGMPSMVLMERAAMCVAACVMENSDPASGRILSICGTGNNGGDGVAAARILYESGYMVSVLVIGRKERCSEEMRQQLVIADHLGLPVTFVETVTEEKLQKYTVIIDAVFGIGLSREITGIYREWVEWMNHSAARVVAVDIPSGIHATTGGVLGIAVQADVTVTFGVHKRGMLLYPGAGYAGEIIVADIGFPQKALQKVSIKAYTYDPKEIRSVFPERPARSHKGSYGRVLVIAGSPQMSGACYFASAAACRIGAGLVHVLTAQENAAVIRTKLPEAIVSTWSPGVSDAEAEKIQEMMDQASVIVAGPGLGQSEDARRLMQLVLTQAVSHKKEQPVVIDADGLNIIAEWEDLFTADGRGGRRLKLPGNIILTPHLREMSRLIRWEVSEIAAHMPEAVSAQESGCTIVLKDARTLVSNGERLYINTTGNSALAKGGAGDVLSGMTGGLLAQGMKPMEAAVLAVCLHGMAADHYIQDRGIQTMLASDLLSEITRIMR